MTHTLNLSFIYYKNGIHYVYHSTSQHVYNLNKVVYIICTYFIQQNISLLPIVIDIFEIE